MLAFCWKPNSLGDNVGLSYLLKTNYDSPNSRIDTRFLELQDVTPAFLFPPPLIFCVTSPHPMVNPADHQASRRERRLLSIRYPHSATEVRRRFKQTLTITFVQSTAEHA